MNKPEEHALHRFRRFQIHALFADLKPFHRLAFGKRASTLETSRHSDLVPA